MMPIYRIYKEYTVEVIFELEASSKREAKSMFLDKNNPVGEYIGETKYIPTGNIDVVERKWEKEKDEEICNRI